MSNDSELDSGSSRQAPPPLEVSRLDGETVDLADDLGRQDDDQEPDADPDDPGQHDPWGADR